MKLKGHGRLPYDQGLEKILKYRTKGKGKGNGVSSSSSGAQ